MAKRKKRLGGPRSGKSNLTFKWDDADTLTGEQYSRRKNHASEIYRLDYKNADYKKWVIDYCKKSEKWKADAKVISKNKESEFRSTLGGLCKLLLDGCPDYHKPYAEYWRGLAGTMGEVKPMTESIDPWLEELKTNGSRVKHVEDEKKKQEKNKPVITIKERIHDQACMQTEAIEEWLEKWTKDPKKFNPDDFKFSKHFHNTKVTQAHARVILPWYEDLIGELEEVINPYSKAQLAKMTEKEVDYHEQALEGYAIYDKKDLKSLLAGYNNLIGALHVVIEMSKANRKTRKRAPKSKDKLVQKLKYRISDDKYHLASINPIDIIGCNELWVFNVKTRKIGKYVASSIDPLKQERDGTGLSVKGTTITGFKEDESIQKTIRKPEEKLKEFHDAGKIKLRDYLEDINAVQIKLNGRINSETILLKAVR